MVVYLLQPKYKLRFPQSLRTFFYHPTLFSSTISHITTSVFKINILVSLETLNDYTPLQAHNLFNHIESGSSLPLCTPDIHHELLVVVKLRNKIAHGFQYFAIQLFGSHKRPKYGNLHLEKTKFSTNYLWEGLQRHAYELMPYGSSNHLDMLDQAKTRCELEGTGKYMLRTIFIGRYNPEDKVQFMGTSLIVSLMGNMSDFGKPITYCKSGKSQKFTGYEPLNIPEWSFEIQLVDNIHITQHLGLFM